MAPIALSLAGFLVFGILVHTAIVNVAAVRRTRIVSDADVEIARICAGRRTSVKISTARNTRHVHRAELPDSSAALSTLSKFCEALETDPSRHRSPPRGRTKHGGRTRAEA
jgi:hypothetical protein